METKVDCIESELEYLERCSLNRRKKWEAEKQRMLPLVKELEVLGIEPCLDGTYSFDISFTGDKEKMLTVWRMLRRYGFKHIGDGPAENEPSWSGYFRNDEWEDSYAVWFSYTSTVCRRVEVRREMQEVPIYEVRCGEDAVT